MSRNSEIKARVRDLPTTAEKARALADSAPAVIDQEDTFFTCPSGRLKLRKFSDDKGELIFYQRPDQGGPKECSYHISPTASPDTLRDLLSESLGVRGTVTKRRTLYLAGQTRIHLDEVSGLGSFVELEVVLRPNQSSDDGAEIAQEFMNKLDISSEDLIPQAYIDLMEQSKSHP